MLNLEKLSDRGGNDRHDWGMSQRWIVVVICGGNAG